MKIAVLGHGVVGSGVAEVLHKNGAGIAGRAGEPIEIKYILDKRDFPDLPYSNKFTKDYSRIVQDPEIGVVVEVMGGLSPAYEFTKQALESGKSVVTSNKELVASRGAELLAAAAVNNVNFLFEASVGGGIPIIRPLHQCLAANQIDEIAGILNGTTNYILSKMIKEGMSFADALKQAQELGYAESDPTADVEGHDACRKICILASLAFGGHVYPDSVHCEGITGIATEDVLYAGSENCVIKLIGRCHMAGEGKVFAMVSPAFIGRDSQLAGVEDVFNAVLVRGNATGDVVFYGKGAGKLPTASAVVADVIDCVKAQGTTKSLFWPDSDGGNVCDYREETAVMYIRCTTTQPEVLTMAARDAFGGIRLLARKNQPANEVAWITPPLTEAGIQARLEEITTHNPSTKVLSQIRVLDY